MKIRKPVGIVPIVLTQQQATDLMLSAAMETAVGYAERVFLATLTPPVMPRCTAAQ
ncbi:hypothetical protein [Lichenifustis flavocetrariae]|uniref:Uncharacterized protein n=1 Tax=Lichenifustis flavocetrariae TaxID=2949735 RepID=A0AA42CQ06_9HYPH|nr:hypothetical protein [Lichenifustis flavocetrariae]MCW6510970.1 hypothetical protein [Lichenifustis flavocetrariae]